MRRFLLAALVALVLPAVALAQTKVNSPITVGPGLNALGPSISTLLPQTCDGVINTTGGAMTAGLATLTGTGFTSADVGKRVAVADVGSNFALSTLNLNAGGAGYVVNELVTLAGGTGSPAVQVRVVAVSGGAVTEFAIVNPGIYTVTTTTFTQASSTVDGINPGAGAGVTFNNVTFKRLPLSTTITGFTNSTSVTLGAAASATDANAAYRYGTDKTAEIQAAIDAGLPVNLPIGICVHTSPIEIKDKTIIVGQGRGAGLTGSHDNTILVYLGAQSASAQILADKDVGGGAEITGYTYGNFALDGALLIAKGIREAGTQVGRKEPVKTLGHTQVGAEFQASSAFPDGNFGHRYEFLDIQETTSGLNTDGIWMGYPNNVDLGKDPDWSRFVEIRVNINTSGIGSPMRMGATDHNSLVQLRLRGPIATPGIEFLGGNWATLGHSRNNLFVFLDAGDGGAISRGTGFLRGASNKALWYDRGNGGPQWTTEPGALFDATDTNARSAFLGLVTTTLADLREVSNFTALYHVSDSPTKVPGHTFLTTDTPGTYRVIALFTGTANQYRVVAAVNDTPSDTDVVVATSTLTSNLDTAFDIVPGMQILLLAGKTYSCRGTLSGTANAGGGIKVRPTASGALTITSMRFRAQMWNNLTIVENTEVTAFGVNLVGTTAAYTNIEFEGVIVVNAGGMLSIQAAQNASFAADTTIVANSHLGCTRIN